MKFLESNLAGKTISAERRVRHNSITNNIIMNPVLVIILKGGEIEVMTL